MCVCAGFEVGEGGTPGLKCVCVCVGGGGGGGGGVINILQIR